MPIRYRLINAALVLCFIAGTLTMFLPYCIVYNPTLQKTSSYTLAWEIYNEPLALFHAPGVILLICMLLPAIILFVKKYLIKIILMLIVLLVSCLSVYGFRLISSLNVMYPTSTGPAIYTATIEAALTLFVLILIIVDRRKIKATLQQ